ncbi:DUF3991 and TOPRIM domain-containing protein [Scatolibacter rhodanostii]|uniref:DUF3991 and TOPRIM domain-containing protein n=1 Tax=Scatolibacter rhodanostii TaxID=2014781 RepID=UPI000C07D0B6|nr:DUF3991 and TOPRIM domain-containing protein [Scatolibacter rhodanostii]
MGNGYIPEEQIEEARQMDLLSYLRNYEPQELKHLSGNTYCLRSHDSLKISGKGLWNWFSQGVGGRNALDFLMKVRGLTFRQAVEQITDRTAAIPPVYHYAEVEEVKKELDLPEKNSNSKRVFAYLMSRGIDKEVISYCMKQGLVYECKNHHNAVFVGKDLSGTPKYAAKRGTATGSNFKVDAVGSDKKYSFSMPAVKPNEVLHLFEAAIDVMSYATLLHMKGKDFKQYNLLSLAGVYAPKKGDDSPKLPVGLERFLKDYPHIKQLNLHIDNDEVRRAASLTIKKIVQGQYTCGIFSPTGDCKDINDYLVSIKREKGLLKTPEKQTVSR